jgi:hypothetical protein
VSLHELIHEIEVKVDMSLPLGRTTYRCQQRKNLLLSIVVKGLGVRDLLLSEKTSRGSGRKLITPRSKSRAAGLNY